MVGGYYFTYEDFRADNESREKIAPYFYSFFAFPGQPGYNTLDLGKYLSLFVLDSDHTNPIDGVQTEWLSEQLKRRKEVLHKIPIYDVGAYSSYRKFNGRIPQRIRQHWLPLFEEHGVKVAFENHDHAYKRTYPLKRNKRDENGIVYIGDGSWGRIPRGVDDVATTWYLKKGAAEKSFVIMTIQGHSQSMLMINDEAQLIDSYPPLVKESRKCH